MGRARSARCCCWRAADARNRARGCAGPLDDGWLDKLDDAFIPSLGNLINSATEEELPKLEELDLRGNPVTEAGRQALAKVVGTGCRLLVAEERVFLTKTSE